ncbi:hypothetical protein ACYSNW_13935 [Enterococcus sp. LJL99]
MNRTEARLQKDKMKQVQLLAVYYQSLKQLPNGEKRDQVIREILVCKNAISKINQQLTELATDSTK